MRTWLFIALAALALAAGLVFFSADQRLPEPLPQTSDEPDGADDTQVHQTVYGQVRDVDLSQMALDGPARLTLTDEAGHTQVIAIPSMGIRLCAAYERMASVADIAAGDRVSVRGLLTQDNELVPCESADHYLTVEASHTDEILGYRFDYLKGPNGYVLVDHPQAETDGGAQLLAGLSLFNRAEYELAQAATEAREGPPSFKIRVYANTQKLSAAVWAMRHPQETNHQLALNEPAEAVVGGANAVYFVADGLWPIDTYVVAHDSKMFVLMGMIPDDGDTMKADFAALVESFEFIPTREQLEG